MHLHVSLHTCISSMFIQIEDIYRVLRLTILRARASLGRGAHICIHTCLHIVSSVYIYIPTYIHICVDAYT